VSGPHFAGWEIYYLKGSPVDSDRLYASASLPLRPLAGLARWFNGRMMTALPGMPLETSSFTKAKPEHINGMTAHLIRGSPNVSDIWNPL
jgi:hypothetical protein